MSGPHRWALFHDVVNMQAHVSPVGDLRDHVLTPQCWCKPTPDEEQPNVLVHHALDQRELVEQGRRAVQ